MKHHRRRRRGGPEEPPEVPVMPHDATEPARGTCEDCGVVYAYDPAFYRDRDLSPPVRCPGCRLDRRRRREQRVGIVYRIGDRFAFVRAIDHALYFAPDLAAASGLRAGDPVEFSVDPSERPEPGRNPRAYDVRPA